MAFKNYRGYLGNIAPAEGFTHSFYNGSLIPTLNYLSTDIVDRAGGTAVTISGLNLSGATVTVGGTAATVTSSTGSALTFIMPAQSAGLQPIVVTNTQGVNTIYIEAWSETDQNMAALFRDYSAVSTWSGTASAGISSAQSFNVASGGFPTVSAALNGHTGATFSGLQYIADSAHFQSVYFGDFPYLINSGQMVFNFTGTIPADPGLQFRYQGASFISNPGGTFGLALSTAGLTFYGYDSTAYAEPTVPNVTANSVHIVQWEVTQKAIRVRVDGGAWYSENWNVNTSQPVLNIRDMRLGTTFVGTIYHFSTTTGGLLGNAFYNKELATLKGRYALSAPYSVQLPVLETSSGAVAPGDTVTVMGRGLANVTQVTINGTAQTITNKDSTSVSFVMPALTIGNIYPITVSTSQGTSNAAYVECFDPTEIGNTILWLRPDKGMTSSGGFITAWADQSGASDSNRTFTSGASVDKVAVTASDSTYNNKATVGPFNINRGNNDAVLQSNGVWSTSYTGSVNTPITDMIIGNAANTSNRYFTFKSNTDYQAFVNSSTTPTVFSGDATYLLSDGLAATTLINTKTLLFTEYAGSSSTLSTNNIDVADVSGSQSNTTFGNSVMYMGTYAPNSTSATSFGVEKIAERIVYNKMLTDGEKKKVGNYFNARYNKALPLPYLAANYIDSLPWTGYWKDFARTPWISSNSAGTSYGMQMITGSGSPTLGTSFNSHPSAQFNGSNQYVRSGPNANPFYYDKYVTSNSYYIDCVFQMDSLGTPGAVGRPYDDPALVADNGGNIYLGISSGGLRAGQYDGTFAVTPSIACTINQKHFAQMWYDGTTISLSLNGGTPVTIASTPGQQSFGIILPRIGANFNANFFVNGKIAQVRMSKVVFDATTRSNLLAIARTDFGTL